jgi:hypothetical protein
MWNKTDNNAWVTKTLGIYTNLIIHKVYMSIYRFNKRDCFGYEFPYFFP